MKVTGVELNLAEDVFKLQHLLDCHLLRHREEVEELTGAGAYLDSFASARAWGACMFVRFGVRSWCVHPCKGGSWRPVPVPWQVLCPCRTLH